MIILRYTLCIFFFEQAYLCNASTIPMETECSHPVSTFFPEWATSKKYVRHANGYIDVVPTEHPVTIRDTLTMKCGLPYCNSDAPTADPTLQGMQNCMKPLWEKGHYTLREQMRAMADAPLAFEPGSH